MTKVQTNRPRPSDAMVEQLKASREQAEKDRDIGRKSTPVVSPLQSLAQDRVSVSEDARKKSDESTTHSAPIEPENGTEAKAESSEGSREGQGPKVVRMDQQKLLELLKKKFQDPKTDPMDSLPKIAIDHRARFFTTAEVDKESPSEEDGKKVEGTQGSSGA